MTFAYRAVALATLAMAALSGSAAFASGETYCKKYKEKYRCDRDSLEPSHHRPGHGNGNGNGNGHGHGRPKWCYREVTRCMTSCAPEVEQGNLAATRKVLAELAARPEFANAAKFRAEVARLDAISEPQAQLGEYFKLVGLADASDEEIMEFLGARSVNPKYVDHLKASVELGSVQAEIVVESLTTALRGNMR